MTLGKICPGRVINNSRIFEYSFIRQQAVRRQLALSSRFGEAIPRYMLSLPGPNCESRFCAATNKIA